MAATGRFKKALFGFRKSAVLDYVEAYQRDSRATIESLSGELDACKEKLTQANEVNAELESKLSECEDALRELQELAESLRAKVDELAAQPAAVTESREAAPEPAPVAEEADAGDVRSGVESMARHLGEKLSRFDRMLAALRQHMTSARRPSHDSKK